MNQTNRCRKFAETTICPCTKCHHRCCRHLGSINIAEAPFSRGFKGSRSLSTDRRPKSLICICSIHLLKHEITPNPRFQVPSQSTIISLQARDEPDCSRNGTWFSSSRGHRSLSIVSDVITGVGEHSPADAAHNSEVSKIYFLIENPELSSIVKDLQYSSMISAPREPRRPLRSSLSFWNGRRPHHHEWVFRGAAGGPGLIAKIRLLTL